MIRTTGLVIGVIVALVHPAASNAGQPPALATDQFGDALPLGAVARLGSLRWRHTAPVSYVAFAADGKSIVSAGSDGFFRIWEYPSGKPLRRFGPGNAERIDSMRGQRRIWHGEYPIPFAISKNGKSAAIFAGRQITVYAVATGKKQAELLLPGDEKQPQFSGADSLAFSPDGLLLAVSAKNGTVYVWEMADAKLMYKLATKQTEGWGAVLAFTADGKQLLTSTHEGGYDNPKYAIRVWDTATGHELLAKRGTGKTCIDSAAFAPDGKLLALVCYDRSVLLVDPATGKTVRTLEPPSSDATFLLFSQDGNTVFKRLTGMAVGQWDVRTGKLLRHFGQMADDEDQVSLCGAALALSPDGKELAVCAMGNRIHFFSLATGQEKNLGGHGTAVDCLQFAAEGSRLWTSDVGGETCVWEFRAAKQATLPPFPDKYFGASISPDGRFAIQQKPHHEGFMAFDLIAMRENHLKWPSEDVNLLPLRLALAPDGKTFAMRWFEFQKIELYDVPSLQLRHTFAIGTTLAEGGPSRNSSANVEAKGVIVFSQNGRYVAACSDLKNLAVWDTITGKKMISLPLPEGVVDFNCAFTPDHRGLLLDLEDGTVLFVELATGKKRHSFGTKLEPSSDIPLEGSIVYAGQEIAQMPKLP